jgi:putative methionine-R-sulfoxide reductase with GAF domain
MVVPMLAAGGAVVGLIDVESEQPAAFGDSDVQCVEECARRLAPWIVQRRPAPPGGVP